MPGKGASAWMPAAWTAPQQGPFASRSAAIAAAQASRSATSKPSATARRPCAATAAQTSSTCALPRWWPRATSKPSRASASAIARPMPRLAPVTRTRRPEPPRPRLAPIEPAGLQLLEAPYDVDVQPALHQGRAPRRLPDLAVEGDEAALPAVVARLDAELAVTCETLRGEAQPARPEQHAGPRRLAARAGEEAGMRRDALRHVLEPDPDRDAAVGGRERGALRGVDA